MILDKNMFVCLLQSSVLYKQSKPNKYMEWNLFFLLDRKNPTRLFIMSDGSNKYNGEVLAIEQLYLAKIAKCIQLVCNTHNILFNLLICDSGVYLRGFDVGVPKKL